MVESQRESLVVFRLVPEVALLILQDTGDGLLEAGMGNGHRRVQRHAGVADSRQQIGNWIGIHGVEWSRLIGITGGWGSPVIGDLRWLGITSWTW